MPTDPPPDVTASPTPGSAAAALIERVRALMPAARRDLEDLVRIPSISLAAYDSAHVEASAQAVAELLRAEGMTVEIVREGGLPAVIGHLPGPPGAPTITLYAHHDVQPVGDESHWHTPPFEPIERDGRLYARGAADDKAGIMAHLVALRAHLADGGQLPVGVTIFVEGEEETGSESLPTILERHGDKLAADAIVLADSSNFAVGMPALTVSLRGLVRARVTVTTLSHSLHSGMFGGPVPDAMTAMIRLLAGLHDEAGDVAVAGLDSGVAADLAYDADTLRAEAGLLPGVAPMGTGSILSRLWTKPSLTVIGIDAPSVATASNTLPASVTALVSMRVSPTQDVEEALAALTTHLVDHAPFGAQVDVTPVDTGSGFAGAASGPIGALARSALADAWGVEPVDIGVGGSIPFVAAFADRFPDAEILVTGVEDPDSRAHGANESLHLREWERACVAETLLLARLGAAARH